MTCGLLDTYCRRFRYTYPTNGIPRVVDGGREHELWGKSVVDIYDHDADLIADASTPRGFALQSSEDPAT